MILHSYFTDGMYDWAKLFLRSFSKHNGYGTKIILDSRNITNKQIAILTTLYNNIEIRNKNIKIRKVAKKAKISVEELTKYKNQIEHGRVTVRNKVWKQFISVEDRYRNSIKKAMLDYMNEDYMLHMDIDMYFRGNIKSLLDVIIPYDISIKFRGVGKAGSGVLGSIIGFKLNKEVLTFMDRWIWHIDQIPLYKKPKGYGQRSFYLAYIDMKNNFSWGSIPHPWPSPGGGNGEALIWAGNRGRKDNTLKRYIKDFKSLN